MLGESHAATLAPQVGAATTPAMGYAHAQFATATPGGQVSYMPVAAPSVSAPMALGMLSNGLNMNGGPNASAGYMSGGGLPRGELQPQVIANGPMVGNPALPATSLASGVAAAVLAQPQGASALGTMMQAGVPAGGPPPSLVNQAQLNAGQLTAQQGAGGGTGQQMNLPIQQEMELELQLRGSLLVQQQRRIVQLEEELSKSWTELERLRSRVQTFEREKKRGDDESKAKQPRYWTSEEHRLFLEALDKFGQKNVKAISNYVGTRTPTQVRTHAQKYFLRMKTDGEGDGEGDGEEGSDRGDGVDVGDGDGEGEEGDEVPDSQVAKRLRTADAADVPLPGPLPGAGAPAESPPAEAAAALAASGDAAEPADGADGDANVPADD